MTGDERPCHLLSIRPVVNNEPGRGRCKAVAACSCGKVEAGWGNIYRTARLSALRRYNEHQHTGSR